ncbi:G5-like (plasmid) [Dictyostelium discoideum]|uniref:G5-like n=1 Tax=Dictyostelium discoideum TaxID=44689 RepID=O60988_DICDI|nr:G5-like [Dictyostelium discoideum]AAC14395.1 G5-like [Dictyostelium discoideum]|eukprot:NP_046748.1 G5-like (plasmid) [Dictyostelium discoideum]
MESNYNEFYKNNLDIDHSQEIIRYLKNGNRVTVSNKHFFKDIFRSKFGDRTGRSKAYKSFVNSSFKRYLKIINKTYSLNGLDRNGDDILFNKIKGKKVFIGPIPKRYHYNEKDDNTIEHFNVDQMVKKIRDEGFYICKIDVENTFIDCVDCQTKTYVVSKKSTNLRKKTPDNEIHTPTLSPEQLTPLLTPQKTPPLSATLGEEISEEETSEEETSEEETLEEETSPSISISNSPEVVIPLLPTPTPTPTPLISSPQSKVQQDQQTSEGCLKFIPKLRYRNEIKASKLNKENTLEPTQKIIPVKKFKQSYWAKNPKLMSTTEIKVFQGCLSEKRSRVQIKK